MQAHVVVVVKGVAMERKYMSVAEFAEKASITTQAVYSQVKNGKLRNYSKKVNGKRRISAEALKLYRPEGIPVPEEQEQTQKQPEGEAVALLREQIRILSETLEHERQTLEHEREMHKQTQEALRQTQELMKAQMVQFALTTKQRPEEVDPVGDPVPGESDQADPEDSEQTEQSQLQTDSESQKSSQKQKRRKGFLSWLSGR